MSEKKKILMIIPNLDFGGAQNSFSRLSWLLHPHCSLLLVVFNKDNIAPLTFGGNLVELQVPASKIFFLKILNFYRRVQRLKEIKKEFQPTTSISFLEGADYVNLLSGIGEEIFFYIHGSKKFDRNIKGLIGFIQKKILIPYLYRFANKILVVNEKLKTELIEYYGLRNSSFVVMPNFFDIQELQEQASIPLGPALEKFFKENLTICISGRIAPEKGIDRFVKLLPEILKRYANVKLLIVGDGDQKLTLQNQLRDMGVSFAEMNESGIDERANVIFFGYQQNPYRFLSRSTLLALPSLNEGMPNTIIEAFCLGIPVVAADCPYGPRELLAPGVVAKNWPELAQFGILVPLLNEGDGSQQFWIEAIGKVLESLELRIQYSKAGLKHAQDFSKENNLSKWKELLKL